MTTLKIRRQVGDLVLHLSFHPSEPLVLPLTVEKVDLLMEEHFGIAQKRVAASPEQLEIVYRIHATPSASSEVLEEFFGNLQKVFALTANLHPHFTQFESDAE